MGLAGNRPDRIALVALLALGAATHLAWFGHPAAVVFDEVHWGRDAVHYLRGSYFFDQHPPLAKLLFAGVAALGGFPAGFDFRAIGEPYPDGTYLWMRALACGFGIALAPLLFLFLRSLGLGGWASFVPGSLLALDGGFVGTARLVLPESMLCAFGLAAMLVASRGGPALAAGLLLGAAASVKWTALPFFVVAAMSSRRGAGSLASRARRAAVALLLAPAFVYAVASFAHLARLRGPGEDLRFHNDWFREYRESPASRETAYDAARFPREFVEIHRLFVRAARDPIPWPPAASRFWEWPLGRKPIPAWGDASRRIYVSGNLAAWWAGLLAVLLALVASLRRRDRSPPTAVALSGWVATLLPFVLMPRPTFLYSYLPAQIFALVAVGRALDRCGRRGKPIASAVLLGAAAATYFLLAPTTYGLRFPVRLGPLFEFLSR